jgi:S-formylglutathione hydrolase FrmB
MILAMLPWSAELAGQMHEHVISSELLRDNPLGDPYERPLLVYTPPGYDDEPDRAYPVVYVIQGYTGHVAMWRNRTAYRQPFPEAADAMFARGDAPPAIVVYVDAWTAYGGSQFVDSPGTGRYHSYLCDEVVAYVDARYRTIPDAAHRAITGKSSGGFGAMITPMLRPDVFGALATHAGDSLYEYSYIPEFPVAVRHLRKYDGNIFHWWDDFRSRVSFTQPEDMSLLGLLGVAACFSARDDATPELPFDPVTGVLRPDVWQRWLDWDPVRMVPRYAAALRGLRGIWIDSGTRDDFNLDVGASAFRAALLEAGVEEDLIYFELFDATHSGIDYRYPLSLAWLCKRITDLSPWSAASDRHVNGLHNRCSVKCACRIRRRAATRRCVLGCSW